MTLPGPRPAARNGDVLPPLRKPLPETPYRVDGGKLVRERQGARTTIQMDGEMVRWATSERVTEEFLKRLKVSRDMNKRAPLGDAHGAWQKVADVPVGWLMDRLPVDAWEDKKALAKVLNDPDMRYLRADGDHRTL
jgi:hypothetical protein